LSPGVDTYIILTLTFYCAEGCMRLGVSSCRLILLGGGVLSLFLSLFLYEFWSIDTYSYGIRMVRFSRGPSAIIRVSYTVGYSLGLLPSHEPIHVPKGLLRVKGQYRIEWWLGVGSTSLQVSASIEVPGRLPVI